MSFGLFVGRAGSATAPAISSLRRASYKMPLKAKIINRGMASEFRKSYAHLIREEIKELPGDDPEDVHFNTLYGLRTIELNRPSSRNSLNASMVRKIIPRLVEWERSDMANVVVIKGAGDKALCAGGDVVALATQNKLGTDGQRQSIDYFGLEYKLDHYIATYNKPFISFMDGITMGGGVGLSIHAPFRIATERTLFAMPETKIGFFPDVGASFFLPKMPGALGTYLALTGARLKGANVFYSGIATHYLHSTSLPNLEARLAELRFRDYDSIRNRLDIIEMTIEEFATGLPPREPIRLGGEVRKAIDRCFSKATVADMMTALEAEQGPTQAWAEETLKTLRERSPTSLLVTLRQMREGRDLLLSEAFKKEYLMAARFMDSHDFNEGVTELLINKTNEPKWDPPTLSSAEADGRINMFFEPPEDLPPLGLLADRDYDDYPFKSFGVPDEKEIELSVIQKPTTRQQLVEDWVARKRGRQGFKKIVEEILARKTTVDEAGNAEWIYN
ncbi:enoyl-CoA hydratase/isomerase [Camillea tinctor]|nr:enoyl-CoA hydratase/isomerase [Camillea tinctor]